MTSDAEVTAAVQQTMDRFGAIHINVNCAGTGAAMKTTSKAGPMPLEIFAKVIEINLIGTFNVLRLCAAQMAKNTPNARRRARRDRQHGVGGGVRRSDRAGGVFGVEGRRGGDDPADRARSRLASASASAPSRPGTFDTPMLAMLPEPQRQALAAQIPFPPRLGKPPEFAALARHIVENAMLNGETIRLDGALRMPPK